MQPLTSNRRSEGKQEEEEEEEGGATHSTRFSKLRFNEYKQGKKNCPPSALFVDDKTLHRDASLISYHQASKPQEMGACPMLEAAHIYQDLVKLTNADAEGKVIEKNQPSTLKALHRRIHM